MDGIEWGVGGTNYKPYPDNTDNFAKNCVNIVTAVFKLLCRVQNITAFFDT